eukprot:COSAG01_NODE_20402_length_955_cov_9.255841_1_plen_190_part_00
MAAQLWWGTPSPSGAWGCGRRGVGWLDLPAVAMPHCWTETGSQMADTGISLMHAGSNQTAFGTGIATTPRGGATCTHCMVQYTPDGGRSSFGSFDRLAMRFFASTTSRSPVVDAANRLYSRSKLPKLERPPSGDSEYFWVPGCSANGCMWAAQSSRVCGGERGRVSPEPGKGHQPGEGHQPTTTAGSGC